MNFVKFLRTLFLTKQLQWLLLIFFKENLKALKHWDILDSKTKYSKIPAQQVEPTLFQQILFVSVSHLNPILPYLFKLLKTSWNLQNQVIVSNVVLYITIVI